MTKRHCDKCKKEDTVFFILPGGVYLCPDCKNKRRAEKKELEED
jgi:uncharacterized Zn finger protein (UPF0148 family)